MRALIELICGVEREALPQLPECHPRRLPGCVQEIRFRIERRFLEPNKPALFYARILIARTGEQFVAELRSEHSFTDLRNRLETLLNSLREFELEAIAA